MGEPVTVIRNLGPALAEALARAGIADAGTLREMGADAAHAAMIAVQPSPIVRMVAVLEP